MRTPRLPVVDWNDAPRRFKWTRSFRRKTKSGFCAWAITFQTQSTYSVCVCVCACVCVCVAIVTQHARRMHSITVSSVSCLALPYFTTQIHKRNEFQNKERKKFWTQIMCFDILSNFVCNIFHYKKKQAKYFRKCSQLFMKSARYSCHTLNVWRLTTHIWVVPHR